MTSKESINKQIRFFDNLKNQNNLFLGFTILFIGFLIPNIKLNYLIPYLGVIFSFSISLFGFYFSTIPLTEDKQNNLKKITSLTKIIRMSIGFLFVSLLIFSSIIIGGLI